VGGWIALHRKFLEWEWYNDHNVKILFLHCLLKANHKEKQWQGLTIERGQFVTGRKKLAKETGLTEQQVRTALQKLNTEITIKTTNKYSVVTVVNYSIYQDKQEENNQQNNQQITNKQPTNNQQITTTNNNNNNNKDNNNNNNIYIVEILDHLNQKANKNFKASNKATASMISARLKEKYTVEDFKKVIDKKCDDWLNSKQMNQYLRPNTLFRPSNFENYLQEVKELETDRRGDIQASKADTQGYNDIDWNKF
jgi:uncharacterized phage protein (TIGR02220 family)